MALRVFVCFVAIAVLIAYSWRRSWFIGACGAVVMMALVEHPEMPRSIFGIPGLSAWNILIINVSLAWLSQRSWEGLVWDLPGTVRFLLYLYLGVVLIAFLRLLINPTAYYTYTIAGTINESFVNSLKFMIPFCMFYDGCRTAKRSQIALVSILVLYVALALIVIKHMGLEGGGAGQDLNGRGAKLIHSSTGYHRVDLAMMLAGASWGVLACAGLTQSKRLKLCAFGSFVVLTIAEALTGGRTGYVTWFLIGLVMCCFRWRRLLLLIPVGVVAIYTLMPAVAERMSMGFGGKKDGVVEETDAAAVTSDRTRVWPIALSGIAQSPWVGSGRYAYVRTGLGVKTEEIIGEETDHPHNAYLEMLLDNGVIGLALVMPVYLVLLTYSLRLFADRANPLNSAAGGLAAALLLALLVAAMGAQTLYPREGVAGMWAAVGVMMRQRVARSQAPELAEEPSPMPDACAMNV